MEGTMSEIRMFAGNFAPKSWAFCNGQLMAIATNSALFSLLGTTYGGDGRTTFGLPNMLGRAPLSPGQSTGTSNYQLGEITGANSVTLNTTNLPSHNHVSNGSPTINIQPQCNTNPGTATEPEGQFSATPSDGSSLYSTSGSDIMASVNYTATSNLVATVSGSSMPIPLGSPFLGINYVICLYGIYPSRN